MRIRGLAATHAWDTFVHLQYNQRTLLILDNIMAGGYIHVKNGCKYYLDLFPL